VVARAEGFSPIGDPAGQLAGRDFIQQSFNFVRGRPDLVLGSRAIGIRCAAYVPARNHDLIVKALEVDHAVVLSGPAGCGREITALAALRELGPELPIRRFSLEDRDTGELSAHGPGGYLIRARDGVHGLSRATELIRDRGGYLIVIADEDQAPISWLASFAVEPPAPVPVYRSWVAVGSRDWADWPDAALLLAGALPGDARRLARLAQRAADLAPGGRDLTQQRTLVAQAYRDWLPELRYWFAEHRQPHDRALLMAAAALAPASENSVYAAAAALAGRLGIRISGAGLGWRPVTELRTLLDEHEEGDQVTFRRPGFAEAALRHTFAEYPLARPDLLTWLAGLVTESLGGARPRLALAARFADLAAEYDEAGSIVQAVQRWTGHDHPDPDFTANPAYLALSRTCLHPVAGVRVRRAMDDWSTTTRLPLTLKLVLAQTCQVLGQTYPALALTRLKHLATRGDRQVMDQVIEAVRVLAETGHRPEILRAVRAWCAAADSEALSATQRRRRRQAGAELFLFFAAARDASGRPELLAGDPRARPADCLPGWRAALDFHVDRYDGDHRFTAASRRWLDAAARHPQLRDTITTLFVHAAGGPRLLPRATFGNSSAVLTADQAMAAVAREWFAAGPPSPERREVKEAITVPLTRNGWLRLLKRAWISARTRRDRRPERH
jgi:hypothetical protein